VHRVAGFPGRLAVDENLARHDGPFGLLAAFTNPEFDQHNINATHDGCINRRGRWNCQGGTPLVRKG
jgi:hypothetical protein